MSYKLQGSGGHAINIQYASIAAIKEIDYSHGIIYAETTTGDAFEATWSGMLILDHENQSAYFRFYNNQWHFSKLIK